MEGCALSFLNDVRGPNIPNSLHASGDLSGTDFGGFRT